MRRFIISFVSIILLYVLQCTVFQTFFKLGGVAPNLVLMFACIVGFMRGRSSGMFTGFFGGMLVDIMSGGSIIGFTAFLFMIAGFFNGLFHKEFAKEQLILPISLVAVCDLIYGIVFYTVSFLLRNHLNFGYYLLNVIFPEMVYTVSVTIFAYILVYYINRKLDLLGRKRQAKNVSTNSH